MVIKLDVKKMFAGSTTNEHEISLSASRSTKGGSFLWIIIIIIIE